MFQKNRFLFVLLFAVQSLFAQIPQGFNYQATVRNQTGELLTNEYVGIRFHIVQGTEQNNPVYSEFHYVPTDDLGSLHLMIGQGTVEAGAFNQIDWSLGDYHMGIEINTGSGFIDMGTTQLMSVPFALYALNSGTNNNASLPQGNTVGDVLSWNGSVWTVATSSWNASLPEVNTYEAYAISAISSSVEGEVLSDGGSSITAKGVVWSENPDPTVALPTKTDEGPGPTFFRSQLTELSPNTTYHYRAYATNSKGSAYGTSYVFTTEREASLLIGEWVMWPNPAAMMIASSLEPETNGTWWANNLQDVGTLACFFDDKYVFSTDKSFQNVVGETTWTEFDEPYCVDAFAPYDGSIEASWIHDVEKGTVQLNGQGSYLGMKRVANGVELAHATDAPSSRTYDILSLTENVLSLRIAVANAGGLDGENAYWYFILAKVGSEEAEIPQTDGDGDGVLDINDECPGEAGALANGCNPEGGEAPAETPTDAPAAPTTPQADVLSIFSDAYTDLAGSDFDPGWGQLTDATIETYAGNEVLQYKNLNYQGLQYTQSDVSGYTKLHLDYWTADATSINVTLISVGPRENPVALPVTTGSWQSVDINLSEYTTPNLTEVLQLKTEGDGTVILDNIYFY